MRPTYKQKNRLIDIELPECIKYESEQYPQSEPLAEMNQAITAWSY